MTGARCYLAIVQNVAELIAGYHKKHGHAGHGGANSKTKPTDSASQCSAANQGLAASISSAGERSGAGASGAGAGAGAAAGAAHAGSPSTGAGSSVSSAPSPQQGEKKEAEKKDHEKQQAPQGQGGFGGLSQDQLMALLLQGSFTCFIYISAQYRRSACLYQARVTRPTAPCP